MPNQVLYGFRNLADAFTERVTTMDVSVINTAIDETLAEHNRQLNALMSLFADTTTDYKRRYKTPISTRLQPMDENGRSRPIRQAGFYDIAFPMQKGGTAWGQTHEERLKSTVQDINNLMTTVLDADVRWMRDHMLAALFNNSTWNYTDEQWGTLTVKGLANNDTDTYIILEGADVGQTENHYFAQANAIASGADDPFPTIYNELSEHPENGGEVIALVPTNLRSACEGLTKFYPVRDSNISYGASVSTLDGNITANLPGSIFGYHSSGVWLCEWRSMVSSYIIGVTTEGDRPLAMRQEPIPELQGFVRVADRNDYPYYESQYIRKGGFGGQNRVGALVYRIGNGSYAIPTNYTSPMP